MPVILKVDGKARVPMRAVMAAGYLTLETDILLPDLKSGEHTVSVFSLLHRSARGRVAQLILDLQFTFEGEFRPRRQEFAQLAGVKPATLSRILTEFVNQGLIRRGPAGLRRSTPRG